MNATIVPTNATERKALAISPSRKSLRQIVTEWLSLGMRHSGLTQTALAGESGVSRATINRLVQGRQDAEQPTIKRLAKAMKYPFPDFDVVFAGAQGSSEPRYSRVPRLPQAERGGGGPHQETGTGVGEPAPVGLTAQQERFVGLVSDALVGAVERALTRDHELEQTRRGFRILGDAFLDLGLKLQSNGVDTTELMTYARELQKLSDNS